MSRARKALFKRPRLWVSDAMMRTWRALLSRLPINWKIMLWSTFILCVLFTAYNIAQFFTIGHWLNNQERVSMQKSMAQLQDYFLEKKAILDVEQIRKSQSYLEKIIDRKQLIRILDQNGSPIVTLTNRLPHPRRSRRVSETDALAGRVGK